MTNLFLPIACMTIIASACARAPEPVSSPVNPPSAIAVATSAIAPSAVLDAGPPTSTPVATGAPALAVLVHKSPTCGCCNGWVDHLRANGFVVQVNDTDDMDPIKSRLGVPGGKASCHTAEIGGYFVEGHVPASDIRRLLAERPAARGLALPGMPIGSPGMGAPGSGPAYTVELIARDGSSLPFQQH